MLRSNNNRETDVLSGGVASDDGKAPPAVPGKLVKQKSRY